MGTKKYEIDFNDFLWSTDNLAEVRQKIEALGFDVNRAVLIKSPNGFRRWRIDKEVGYDVMEITEFN